MNIDEFEKDWRNMGQMEYLFKRKVKFQKFADLMIRDHEHCRFCWEKFSMYPESLQEGYCTDDIDKFWICSECFNDFKGIFEWKIV